MNDSAMIIILEAALNAVASGDARVEDDGDTIRWDEDCRSPLHDTLVGVSKCDGRWAPLIEAAAVA